MAKHTIGLSTNLNASEANSTAVTLRAKASRPVCSSFMPSLSL